MSTISRYFKQFKINESQQDIIEEIDVYLKKVGFYQISYRGKTVYKKGEGFLTEPKYIHINSIGNIVRLEAWVKFSIMPFVHVFEMNHTKMKFISCVAKSDLAVYINKIEIMLERAGRN